MSMITSEESSANWRMTLFIVYIYFSLTLPQNIRVCLVKAIQKDVIFA
jgi:hypothetical protein